MTEMAAGDFEALCACEAVRERIGATEEERRSAVRKFWIRLALGLPVSVAALLTLLASGWEVVAFLVFVVLVIVTIVAAISPVMSATEGLKLPVLEEIAKRAGMEYIASEFEPPVYASARTLLFGGGLSSQTFTDLFHGADADGRGYAVYEATLQKSSGKNSYIVFSGQMYAFHRRPSYQGYTVVVPDKKIFNFFKPASDMERVAIEGDDEFERRFEVYSTQPMEARQLLFDSELRRELLDLRKAGKVLVYAGPDAALVAATGKNRFEPGNMFRSRPGQERVRMMFDDVCASLDVLRRLRAKLG